MSRELRSDHIGRFRVVGAALFVLCGVAVFERPVDAQQSSPPFPLTFQQAVQYAIDNYPAVRASMARISAQQSSVDLAQTAYLPRLDWSLQDAAM